MYLASVPTSRITMARLLLYAEADSGNAYWGEDHQRSALLTMARLLLYAEADSGNAYWGEDHQRSALPQLTSLRHRHVKRHTLKAIAALLRC